MSGEDDSFKLREAITEGLDTNEVDMSAVLSALKRTPLNYFDLVKESSAFIKELVATETPSEPKEIMELDEAEVIFATYRANFFEKIRVPALDDNQLEHLLMQTHELWGEHPTEPVGRWVNWCLWTHLNRRQNGVSITEVIVGGKTAKDMKVAWVERHQAREERRRLQKVDNYDRYNTPENIPKSIQQIIMSPFIKGSEMEQVEIELGESRHTNIRKQRLVEFSIREG